MMSIELAGDDWRDAKKNLTLANKSFEMDWREKNGRTRTFDYYEARSKDPHLKKLVELKNHYWEVYTISYRRQFGDEPYDCGCEYGCDFPY